MVDAVGGASWPSVSAPPSMLDPAEWDEDPAEWDDEAMVDVVAAEAQPSEPDPSEWVVGGVAAESWPSASAPPHSPAPSGSCTVAHSGFLDALD